VRASGGVVGGGRVCQALLAVGTCGRRRGALAMVENALGELWSLGQGEAGWMLVFLFEKTRYVPSLLGAASISRKWWWHI
jgi:hypothetical protein